LSYLQKSLSRWSDLSPASRHRKIACLKSFLAYLHQEGEIQSPLQHHWTCPPRPQKIPQFLSVDEAIGVLSVIRKDLSEARSPDERKRAGQQACLFLLIYGGGLRVSEALSAQRSRLSMDRAALCVLGKGGLERWVSIPRNILLEVERLSEHPYLIGGEAPLAYPVALKLFKELGRKAGLLRPLKPHSLRHSYATHLLSSGVNLRTLQCLLGHQTLQSTQKYTHLDLEHLTQVMNAKHPLK
jgi:integrase/recombinase XerC/integrase/recombinase XerD